MSTLQRNTFAGLLDWLNEIEAPQWLIHVQATQFETGDYAKSVSPLTGFLVLNISVLATRNFLMEDDTFSFKSRLNGKEVFLEIPYTAVFAAIDPRNGEPVLYPYFKDREDPTPKMPPKQYTAVFNENRKAGLHIPTMEDITKMMGDTSKEGFSHYQQHAGRPCIGTPLNDAVEPPTALEKMKQRNWHVVEGSKQSIVIGLPFIDVAYRAKRDARDAVADAEPPVIPDPNVRELRSDGASGISSHFPDLDVAKCVFHTNPIPRPEWMTIIEGGQQ